MGWNPAAIMRTFNNRFGLGPSQTGLRPPVDHMGVQLIISLGYSHVFTPAESFSP